MMYFSVLYCDVFYHLPFQRVVLEMNRIGMAVDLSHVSRKTMLDAIKFSHAPVMFSHSGAYSLCAHHRNVHDDVLLKLVTLIRTTDE